jgi:hypothetical protein
MNKETFEATVNYNNMVGSVSADHADHADHADQTSIYHWLDARDLRTSKEELVFGIQLFPDENYGNELVNPVKVTLLLITGESTATLRTKIERGDIPLEVRRIETVMTLPEFFSLFKQINLTLSVNQNKNATKGSELKGILEGVSYQYQD